MKALLTGASGFLGKAIHRYLIDTGYIVHTLARNGATVNFDLSTGIPKLKEIDLVVHCAGKAHFIPKNDHDRKLFFDINENGTKNLLRGLEKTSVLPKSFVFISSVAVYGCEEGILIDETSDLKAEDAYGRSKINAENAIMDWCIKNNVRFSILRLPLLIGKNPPGNLASMIHAISKGYYFNVAGGAAKKSMVLIEDVAAIIPKAAEIGGIYNLTDGFHPSFKELSNHLASQLNKGKILNLPDPLARIIAIIGDLFGNRAPINSSKLKKMTADLTFNDSKAKHALGWDPQLVLNTYIIGTL
jgi:nucleoside-diphosphate-sugar epimerase